MSEREFNFTKSGPQLTEGDLFEFQREYGLILPAIVKEFLLKHNGGALAPPMAFDWRGRRWEVTGFLKILPRADWSGIRRELETLRESGIDWCVPLIWTLTEGVIGVDVRAGAGQMVYFKRESNLWRENDNEDLGPLQVATDFTTFLSMLYENPDPYCRVRDIGKSGSASDVAAYLDDGNDIDARGLNGNTLLYEASAFGNLEVIRTCVDRGADFADVLHVAVSGGKVKAVELLLELGADVNVRNSDGFTPYECLGGIALPGEYGDNCRAVRDVLLKHGASE